MKNDYSLALSESQEQEVKEAIAIGKKKYEKIAYIVCESEIDASVYFRQDLIENPKADC